MDFEVVKQELQAKYGKVIELTVPLDEDDLTKVAKLFLRRPDKTTRSLVGNLVMKDSFKAIEACLKNLWIGGDSVELVTSNDYALASCDEAVVEILSVQKATLKKN